MMIVRAVCLVLLLSSLIGSDAFVVPTRRTRSSSTPTSPVQTHDSTRLFARAATQTTAQRVRRSELLSRDGAFFKLDRFKGAVEFGSAAQLVTQLDTEPNPDGIAEWLSDGRGLALSIWDETMMKDLGNSVYQLRTMKLQFVTIQLSPTVDVQMWTRPPDDNTKTPVFSLQSVSFEPNIQLLPGVGISAASLGIQIDVAGELRPSKDGRGVTGSLSFATKGILPPPMRLLPEGALKLASNTINDTIVQFAVQSFQKGATLKYKEFLLAQEQEMQ
jgi:hypothetical protein